MGEVDAMFACEPCDPEVADMWRFLDADAREYFDERAAIAEYEGGLSRAEAEALAMRLTVAYVRVRGWMPEAGVSGNGPEGGAPP